jgi:hypothetical protein
MSDPTIRVQIGLGGADQVEAQFKKLTGATQGYLQAIQQLPKATNSLSLFTGAATAAVQKLKMPEASMRSMVSLTAQAAGEARGLSAAVAGMPNLAGILGLGEIPAALSQLRSVVGLIGRIGSTAGGLASLGVAGVAFGLYSVYQNRRELDAKATATIEGANQESLTRLQKVTKDRIASGELRGGAAADAEATLASIQRQLSRAVADKSIARDIVARSIQQQLVEASRMIREDSKVTFATEEDAARQHAQARVELTREQLNTERQSLTQHLAEVLADESTSSDQRLQAAEDFVARRRGMANEVAGAELAQIAVEDRILRAQRERAEGNVDAQTRIDNQLAALGDQRVLVEERKLGEIEAAETEHQQRVAAIRRDGSERERRERLQAAQRDSADLRRQLQRMADDQAAAEQQQAMNRARIDSDFRLTEGERRRLRLGTIEAEIQATDLQIERYQELVTAAQEALAAAQRANASPELQALMEQRLGSAENALRDSRRRRQGIEVERVGITGQADPDNAIQQVESRWTALMIRMGTDAQNLANVLVAPFEGLFTGLSSSIEGLINGTMRWGDALMNIGRSVVQSLVKAFADMVAQWIMSHIIMRGVSLAWAAFTDTLRAADVAKSNAAEAAKTPALAANATLASIGSWGTAVLVGVAAIAAILASVGAFADGGLVTGPGGPREDRVLARLSPGEYVVPADAVQAIGMDRMEQIRDGNLPVAAAASPNVSMKAGDVSIAAIFGPEMMNQWAESTEGRRIIVNIMTGAKMDLGMQA